MVTAMHVYLHDAYSVGPLFYKKKKEERLLLLQNLISSNTLLINSKLDFGFVMIFATSF